MRKLDFYPALALGLGAAAAVLRMWQRAVGYDASGLPIPFAVSSVVLTVFLCLCAGGFLLLALKQPKTLADQPAALPGRGSATMFTFAGILVLESVALALLGMAKEYLQLSSALLVSEESRQEYMLSYLFKHVLLCLRVLASVPTAAALLVRAKHAKSGDGPPKPFAVMMPPIFCWLLLIEVYRGHTSNPIVWDYVLLLLACVALLVSTYERAGFAFGVGKPRRTVFTTSLALLLVVAALPDCGGLANAAALIALAFQAWEELPALLRALENAPAEPDEESIQQEDASHEPK